MKYTAIGIFSAGSKSIEVLRECASYVLKKHGQYDHILITTVQDNDIVVVDLLSSPFSR